MQFLGEGQTTHIKRTVVSMGSGGGQPLRHSMLNEHLIAVSSIPLSDSISEVFLNMWSVLTFTVLVVVLHQALTLSSVNLGLQPLSSGISVVFPSCRSAH